MTLDLTVAASDAGGAAMYDRIVDSPPMRFDRFTTLTFDCYGTLIDWERGIGDALAEIFEAHGAGRPVEELLALYAEVEPEIQAEAFRPYREVLREVVRRCGARAGFRPTHEEVESLPDSLAHWPPFADTCAALVALAERFELVVISNVDDDLFAGSARQLGPVFAHVITAGQMGAYKPDPRLFEAAFEVLDRPREEILHVAQSLFHDIVPARRLGLSTVWVDRRSARSGSGATPPSTATPDLIVPDLATLARLVADLSR